MHARTLFFIVGILFALVGCTAGEKSAGLDAEDGALTVRPETVTVEPLTDDGPTFAEMREAYEATPYPVTALESAPRRFVTESREVRPTVEEVSVSLTASPPGGWNEIWDLALAPDGAIWAAVGRGVVRWFADGTAYELHEVPAGFPPAALDAIIVDDHGHVWLAAEHEATVYLARLEGHAWSTLSPHTVQSENGYIRVNDLAVDEDGVAWVATTDGLLAFDGTSWSDHLPGQYLHAVHAGDRGVSALTMKDGVHFYAGDRWIRRRMPTTSQPLSDAGAVDAAGDWWIAEGSNRVWHFDGEQWLKEELPGYGYRFQAVTHTLAGDTWLGAGGGLVHLQEQTRSTIRLAPGEASGDVQALLVGADDSLWIGTRAGLVHHDGDTWTRHLVGDAPLGSNFHAMVVDDRGVAWFATDAGVTEYDGTRWRNYTTADGLPGNTVLSVALTPDGAPVAGCVGGLARFTGDGWEAWRMDTAPAIIRGYYVWPLAISGGGDPWLSLQSPQGMDLGVLAPEGDLWTLYVAESPYDEWADYLEGAQVVLGGVTQIRAVENVLPSPWITGLAATGSSDIWIASGGELVHFDGTTWEIRRLPHEVTALITGPSGELWVMGPDAVSQRGEGGWTTYLLAAGLESTGFFAPAAAGAAGALWWPTAGGVARLAGDRVTHFLLENVSPYGNDAVGVDGNGVVWLSDFTSFTPPEERR